MTAHGFKASWTVPYVARGVAEAGLPSLIGALGATEMSTAFVEPANPYQSVDRSLKYTLLFVGLVFLAYFIFETASDRRLHPAQYVLVGLAQIIFYLLLLSISEQLGFDAAFLIAAAATVGLISLNVSWVFGGIWRFLVAFVLFSGLYGLIYLLMRLEDYALLVGAIASFVAIAAVMYFTRRIDWYGGRKPGAASLAMVAFTLPRNSQGQDRQALAGAGGAKKVKTFRIYRYDPDDGREPALGHL